MEVSRVSRPWLTVALVLAMAGLCGCGSSEPYYDPYPPETTIDRYILGVQIENVNMALSALTDPVIMWDATLSAYRKVPHYELAAQYQYAFSIFDYSTLRLTGRRMSQMGKEATASCDLELRANGSWVSFTMGFDLRRYNTGWLAYRITGTAFATAYSDNSHTPMNAIEIITQVASDERQ